MKRLLEGTHVRAIVDGGAYVGSTAVRFSELFPAAAVYAFEPQASTYAELEATCREHPRITPVRYALGRRSASGRLQLGALPYTSSVLRRPKGAKRYYPVEAELVGSEPVEIVSLDDWARASQIRELDVLKLDIQGYELEALMGAAEQLRNAVKIVYTEVQFVPLYEGACQFHEVAAFLEQHDFALYNLYDLHSAEDGQLIYADAVFIRNALRSDP
jgi:FkbM family methyltransferase